MGSFLNYVKYFFCSEPPSMDPPRRRLKLKIKKIRVISGRDLATKQSRSTQSTHRRLVQGYLIQQHQVYYLQSNIARDFLLNWIIHLLWVLEDLQAMNQGAVNSVHNKSTRNCTSINCFAISLRKLFFSFDFHFNGIKTLPLYNLIEFPNSWGGFNFEMSLFWI